MVSNSNDCATHHWLCEPPDTVSTMLALLNLSSTGIKTYVLKMYSDMFIAVESSVHVHVVRSPES